MKKNSFVMKLIGLVTVIALLLAVMVVAFSSSAEVKTNRLYLVTGTSADGMNGAGLSSDTYDSDERGCYPGTVTGNFMYKTFSPALDASKATNLVAWIYTDTPSGVNIRLGISSNGAGDNCERMWVFTSLNQGWNKLTMPMQPKTADDKGDAQTLSDNRGGNFNAGAINYLRFFRNAGNGTHKLGEVYVEVPEDSSSQQTSSEQKTDDNVYLISGTAADGVTGAGLGADTYGGSENGCYAGTVTGNVMQRTFSPAVDGSKATNLVAWIYTDTPSGINIRLGISSNGAGDNCERMWVFTSLNQGWNKLTMPMQPKTADDKGDAQTLSDNRGGNFDASAINYLRFFRNAGNGTHKLGLVYLEMPEESSSQAASSQEVSSQETSSQETSSQETSSQEASSQGTSSVPANRTYVITATQDEVASMSYYSGAVTLVEEEYDGGKHGAYSDTRTSNAVTKAVKPTLNLKGGKNLVAWIYVSDTSGVNIRLSIGSGGQADTNERMWVFDSTTLQPGWNKVTMPVSPKTADDKGSATMLSDDRGGAVDLTKINYVRFFRHTGSGVHMLGEVYVEMGGSNVGTADYTNLALIAATLLFACAAAFVAVYCGKKKQG